MILRVLLLFLIFSSVSCRDSYIKTHTLQNIYRRKSLKIGVTINFPPYSYLDMHDTFQGLDVERGKRLASRLGVKPEFVPTTYEGLINDLRKHKFDIAMCGLNPTETRKRYGFFSVPYTKMKKVFVTRCKNKHLYNGDFKNIDRSGVKILVGKGHSNAELIKGVIKQATVVEAGKFNLSNIILSEGDLFFTDEVFANVITTDIPYMCVVNNTNMPSTDNDFAYYMPKDKEWKEFIDGWLLFDIKKYPQSDKVKIEEEVFE